MMFLILVNLRRQRTDYHELFFHLVYFWSSDSYFVRFI